MHNDFLDYLQQEAESLRREAAFNGSYHDGGLKLLEQIGVYKAGTEGLIPSVWGSYYEEYIRYTNDKEYNLYLKLKEKFEK